jgi:hypothetical protein
MASITARPFKLALVQLAGLGKDKTANLKVAANGMRKAVTEGKADLVVLPVSPIHIHDITANWKSPTGNLQLSLRRHCLPSIRRTNPLDVPSSRIRDRNARLRKSDCALGDGEDSWGVAHRWFDP